MKSIAYAIAFSAALLCAVAASWLVPSSFTAPVSGFWVSVFAVALLFRDEK